MYEKVMKALEGRKWILLNQYYNKYPMDWNKTIKECLEDKNNLYEFLYDSNNNLKRIRIITNYGEFNSEWNFYIKFED